MSTILIIDDDDQLRISFHKLLSEEGYTAEGAASGEAGLEIVRNQSPDLVILDVRLPGMNGLEIARCVGERWPDIPVILISGKPPPGIRERVKALGLIGFLRKPFSPAQLVELVEMALAG